MGKYQEKLIAEGYCDPRGAGFCAKATRLPRGEYGIVALCVVDKWLNLYDVDLKSNIGQLLYTVNLKQIENLKIRTGFFSQVLKFEYNGEAYSFTDFVGVKPALQVIEEEANNR